MIVLYALTHLPPDVALLVLTAGLLVIFLELNRPGWIIPGTTGLLLTLFSIDSLAHFPLRPPAIVLILTALAVLLLNLLRPIHSLSAVAATLALILGLDTLIRGTTAVHVHTLTAISCGLLLGPASYLLTTIARRARTNKRVRLT